MLSEERQLQLATFVSAFFESLTDLSLEEAKFVSDRLEAQVYHKFHEVIDAKSGFHIFEVPQGATNIFSFFKLCYKGQEMLAEGPFSMMAIKYGKKWDNGGEERDFFLSAGHIFVALEAYIELADSRAAFRRSLVDAVKQIS